MSLRSLRGSALFVVGLVWLFDVSSVSFAATVPWAGASATFDQNFGSGVAGAIDGNTTSSGWAVFGGHLADQSAMFTAAAPVNAPNLYIQLHQLSTFEAHNINEFRISVTQDAAPSFGGTWTPLALSNVDSSSSFTIFEDAGSNRVRARANVLGSETYTASAAAPFAGITAFRLETFPYDYNIADALPASIGHAVNGNIVLTEFVVNDVVPPPAPFNHALGRVASTNGSLWHGYSPGTLVDGNRGSVIHGDGTGGPTGIPPAAGFYYQIDLGTTVDVDHIDIWPRQDGCCPERLTNYRVSLHSDVGGAIGPEVWHADMRTDLSVPAAGPTPPDVVSAGMGVGIPVGNWLRVTSLQDPVPNYALQLGEIEVYGDRVGPPPPPLPSNAALGKPTEGNVAFDFPTWRGVNGNAGDITHSNNMGPVYWQVDLLDPHNLTHVELVNRSDGCCPERLNGAIVSVLDGNFDTLFVSDPIAAAGVAQVFTFDNAGAGFAGARYIRVDHEDQYLSVGEVRAFGTIVPEPTTWLIAMGALLSGLWLRGRRRHGLTE
jgi:hypothetical protein